MKLISAYSSQTTIIDLGTTSIGTILSLNLLSALNAVPKLSLLDGVSSWLRSPLNQSYSIGVASAGTQRGIRTTSLAALPIVSSRICHLLLMLLLAALTILSVASLEAPTSLALASVPPLGVSALEPLHALSSEPLMNTATPASCSTSATIPATVASSISSTTYSHHKLNSRPNILRLSNYALF